MSALGQRKKERQKKKKRTAKGHVPRSEQKKEDERWNWRLEQKEQARCSTWADYGRSTIKMGPLEAFVDILQTANGNKM